MVTCELCGDKLANSKEGYKAHMTRFHAVMEQVRFFVPSTTIKPLKISNRSKGQIVHDMEKTWNGAIIPSVRPWEAYTGR